VKEGFRRLTGISWECVTLSAHLPALLPDQEGENDSNGKKGIFMGWKKRGGRKKKRKTLGSQCAPTMYIPVEKGVFMRRKKCGQEKGGES